MEKAVGIEGIFFLLRWGNVLAESGAHGCAQFVPNKIVKTAVGHQFVLEAEEVGHERTLHYKILLRGARKHVNTEVNQETD